MKKMIGLALITGLLTAGCRPLALPVPPSPVEPVTTTTIQTGLDPAAKPTQASDLTEQGPSVVVDIDLGQLDELLDQLDSALADVDGAMKEGDEQ